MFHAMLWSFLRFTKTTKQVVKTAIMVKAPNQFESGFRAREVYFTAGGVFKTLSSNHVLVCPRTSPYSVHLAQTRSCPR
jgi:hypothetical protein